MKIRIKTKFDLNNVFFILSFSLYCFYKLINSSLYMKIIPGGYLKKFVYLIIIVILIMKWVMFVERYTIMELVICAFGAMICIIDAYKNGYNELIIILALLLLAENIGFNNILRCLLVNLSVWTIFIILSCLVGILPDYTYVHPIGLSVNIAHSLGFQYYGSIAYVVMTITGICLYLHRDLKYRHLVLIVAINLGLYTIHTTGLALGVGIALVLLYIFTCKFKILMFRNRIWRLVALSLPTACCAVTMGLLFMYQSGKLMITLPFLNTILMRFKYSVQALEEYGIHLFGSNVIMYGNTAYIYGEAESAFFIDSGYVYIVIAYGLVFTAFLLLVYGILYEFIYCTKDPFLYGWIGIMLCVSMANNFLIGLIFNPIFFLLPNVIKYKKKQRQNKGQIQNRRRKMNRKKI